MSIHPNSLNNLKPIQKGQKNHPGLNKRKTLVDKFYNFMGDLPDGVYPWELIQGAITDENCPKPEVIKGAAILGNWIIKESETNVEVNAKQVVIADTEQRIRDMVKTQEELDAEAQEADQYETDE